MRTASIALLIAGICLAQDAGYETLAAKCGSLVQWSGVDPWRPEDGAMETGTEEDKPKVDRLSLLKDAQDRARKERKLILWFVHRAAGSQMYRAPVPERYAAQVFFGDPEIAEIVNRRFVPIRLFADPAVGEATGIKAPGFVEPGIVFMDGDGLVLHKVDRIRTFNASWFLSLLSALLKDNARDEVTGDAEARLLAGDHAGAAAALEKPATPKDRYLKARLLRRLQDPAGALAQLEGLDPAALPEVEAERGLILLRQGKLDDAAAALERASARASGRQAEALYHLAVIDRLRARDASAGRRLAALVKDHAGDPWGWRAAACLNRSKDSTPDGALVHSFEDPFFAPVAGLPADTCRKRTAEEADDIARQAVEFLLRHQREDGSWSDMRYAYWPDASITPNVRMAVTSLACAALREWREIDPARVDAAIARGEAYALDDRNLNRGKNEEIYADAYRVLMLARKPDFRKDKASAKAFEESIRGLQARQTREGYWSHEYPNAFCTAAVMQCLAAAKKAGVAIPEALFRKGAQALESCRGDDGSYPYDTMRDSSSVKDSAARMAACESALLIAGRGRRDRLEAAVDTWWKTLDRVAAVRRNDFHTDGELAGFFFFHGVFHTSEAFAQLEKKDRAGQRKRLLELLVAIPEIDGSFVDTHEIGKCYGTAMALLSLKNARRSD